MNEQHEEFLKARVNGGEVVLVLGAGVNFGSRNRRGTQVKFADGLAALLAEKSGFAYNKEPLSEVVTAVEFNLGRDAINKILTEEFRFTQPSDDVRRLFRYTWKRVYTFNYDDVLSEASRSSHQRVTSYNGMSDQTEDVDELTNLQLVYLHGKIEQLDKGILLSESDYSAALVRKKHAWYRQLVQDYRSSTVIFLGSALDEPVLEAEIERASKSFIGRSGLAFLLTPSALSPIRRTALASRNIIHIQFTLADLLKWLSSNFGDDLRPVDIVGRSSIIDKDTISRFSTDDISAAHNLKPISKSDLLNALDRDDESVSISAAKSFLNGFPPTWKLAASDVPVKLQQLPRLIGAIKSAANARRELFITIVQSGSGKSTSTMQALVELSASGDYQVFELDPQTKSIAKALHILERLNDRPKLLFLPNLFIFGPRLVDDFDAARRANVTFVSTARSSEWKEYFRKYFDSTAANFSLDRFSEEDYAPIVERLKRFVPATAFIKLKPAQQLDRLARSKKQLLIALREATESKNVDEIILDEFRRLPDDDVRALFIIVGIATLARVGISPESAAEAYAHMGFSRDFASSLASLAGIVAPDSSGRLVARHEFYVRNILDEAVDLDLTFSVMKAMLFTFTKYQIPVTKHVSRPEAALFRFLLNREFVRERDIRGGNKFAGLDIYSEFEIHFQLDGHFWLQYGLYYQRIGDFQNAIDMLDKSIQAYPGNAFAIHARAQERLFQARNRAVYDSETRKLISDAVVDLERLSANPLLEIDQYPLVTLGNLHTIALI